MKSFVCFSINNWEKRKARKQQFMLQLSQRDDVGRVLYVEPALNFWRLVFLPFKELGTRENRERWQRALLDRAQPVSQKLFVMTPIFFIPFAFRVWGLYNVNLFFLCRFVEKKCKKLGFRNIVLWLYHPFDVKLVDWFRDRVASCFDWAEEWSEYFIEHSARRKKVVRKLEEKMLSGVDTVFVVSVRLLEDAKKYNPRVTFLRDGTIPEIFEAYEGEVPLDLKMIPRPICCYVGTIAARMDVSLIKKVSQELADCSFVFIGAVHRGSVDISSLKQAGNIFFLGAKRFDELPAYLAHSDVCFLPYGLSPLTSPPTKIFDYLATGKPIVSTALPALEDFRDCVRLAASPDEFVRLLKEALVENDAALREKRKQRARENSWAARAEEIMSVIERISSGEAR